MQAQVISKRLTIFIIINFPISRNQYFIFIISIPVNRRRNLQQGEAVKSEIILHPDKDYDGTGDQIINLVSDKEVESNEVIVEDLKDNDEIEIKILNDNKDNLNTKKS